MIVAQLVEQLLLTREIRCSNPEIYPLFVHFTRKDKNKVKKAGNGPSFEKVLSLVQKQSVP